MGVPMNKKSKNSMYKLIRDLSDIQGIARMTLLCLNAFIESIRQLKCTKEEFDSLYKELAQTLRKSQPNIIPLIHLLEFFELDLERDLKPEMEMDEVKNLTIQSLEQRIAQFKRNTARVTENGLANVQNRDVIAVHSASTVVINILIQAKEKLNRQFKVIILDHFSERTRQAVQALRESNIEHIIIPAHNLSHHIEDITKMFVGAMTVTKDRKIVAPVGTAGTVSLCRLNDIKVYLYANTLHYSHRNSMDQNIFQVQQEAHIGITDFSLTTHSHDLVSLRFIDHIITEIGEVSEEGKLIAPPVSVSRVSDSVKNSDTFSIPLNSLPEMSPA